MNTKGVNCHAIYLIVSNVAALLVTVQAFREHKVHNIVLYPDRQSWCKTTPVKQILSEPGYEHKVVENNVCVGTCFSYSVPQTSDITLQPYCDSCQPSDTHWFHITLKKLPNADEELDVSEPLAETFRKRIQIIANCTCLNCKDQGQYEKQIKCQTKINSTELPAHYYSQNTSEHGGRDHVAPTESYFKTLDVTLDADEEETPASTMSSAAVLQTLQSSVGGEFKLPQFLNNDNRSAASNATNEVGDPSQKYKVTKRMVAFLKRITNAEDDTDWSNEHGLLDELLSLVEGPHYELNDRNLMEFVNFINVYNSDDFELDVARLRHVLVKYLKSVYQKETLLRRHKLFVLGLNHYPNGSDANVANTTTQKPDVNIQSNEVKTEEELNFHEKGDPIVLILSPTEENCTSSVYNQPNVVKEFLVPGPHGSLVASGNTQPPR